MLVDVAEGWVCNFASIHNFTASAHLINRCLSSHNLISSVRKGHLLHSCLLLCLFPRANNVLYGSLEHGVTQVSSAELAQFCLHSLNVWRSRVQKRRDRLLAQDVQLLSSIVVKHRIGAWRHTLPEDKLMLWLVLKLHDLVINPLVAPPCSIGDTSALKRFNWINLQVIVVEAWTVVGLQPLLLLLGVLFRWGIGLSF